MDKRKVTVAAAVAVAAAGIVSSAALDTPLELMQPVPLVETLEDSVETGDSEQEERRPVSRIRAQFAKLAGLPETVRALIAGLPLWGIGGAAAAGLLSLLSATVLPVIAHALTWLLIGGVAVAVLGASVKAALPDVPVRELVKPRNLLPLLGTTALLAGADIALCVFSEAAFPRWIWHLGAGAVLAVVCAGTIRREKRRALEEAERRAEEPPTLEYIQETARRLADSVCPARCR